MSTPLETTAGPHVCSHKFAFFLDNRLRRLFQNPRKIVGPYITPGDTVLDIGCGPGFFTIDMAKLVGATGRVVAIDLQAHMLKHVQNKAARHGISTCIEYHQCAGHSLGLDTAADFILAFYMVHETPDPGRFLGEVRNLLKPNGRFLAVEPKLHVGQTQFEEMVASAARVGLKADAFPKKKGGRAVLFSV